jgi:cytochrome c553
MCHGERLEGTEIGPRLAGVHPIYTVRQLYQFKEGTRNGGDAVMMLGPSGGLTDQDIVDVAAFAGSLPPQ